MDGLHQLTTCFLRVRSIIFFLIYPQAWCIAWMLTRPKVTKPETETLYLQDRDETETFNLQDRDETESRDRLETETFKTDTSSLECKIAKFFRGGGGTVFDSHCTRGPWECVFDSHGPTSPVPVWQVPFPSPLPSSSNYQTKLPPMKIPVSHNS